MTAGWKTLNTQNNSLTIDLLESKNWTTINDTTGWILS